MLLEQGDGLLGLESADLHELEHFFLLAFGQVKRLHQIYNKVTLYFPML
jgi:hypothetical protein